MISLSPQSFRVAEVTSATEQGLIEAVCFT